MSEADKKWRNKIQAKIDELQEELNYPTTEREAKIQIKLLESLLKKEND